MPVEVNVLALVKGQERYIYVYDDDSRQELTDAFRDHAASPSLSLTWFDVVVLARKLDSHVEPDNADAVPKAYGSSTS